MILYTNIDSILNSNVSQFGIRYKDAKRTILYPEHYSDSVSLLVDIYSVFGDYLETHKKIYQLSDKKNYLEFDIVDLLNTSLFKNGSFKLNFVVVESILNSRPITEISPDRTEIKLKANQSEFNLINNLKNQGSLNNLVISRDNNRYPILNSFYEDGFIYFKIYGELTDQIGQNNIVDFYYELTDNLIETVSITTHLIKSKSNALRGPKFDIDADATSTDSTVFKSWDDLLSSDSETSQSIIDKIFNVDKSVVLNIDWTHFDNYCFYSRAKTRLENFYEKVKLVEQLNAQYLEESAIFGNYPTASAELVQGKIDVIINNFDAFERFLYYVSDPHIFTHDAFGPVTPWPKDSFGVLKASNDPDVIAWLTQMYSAAETYDDSNAKALWYSIPEFILMDEANSNYVLFVEMVAHHFDNIWVYINALTSIHDKDEHPERGAPNELLRDIAESFGWKLSNARSSSDLWLYKDGVAEDGTDVGVDNMLPHEMQTYNIWKRIVNNLPYLLKTKGSYKSIRALMSIYGIPHTLLSIKEYGGPGIDGDKPLLIEDRYHYKIYINESRLIKHYLPMTNEFIDPECLSNLPDVTLKNGQFQNGLLHWNLSGSFNDYPVFTDRVIDLETHRCLDILGDVSTLILSQIFKINKPHHDLKIRFGILQLVGWPGSLPAVPVRIYKDDVECLGDFISTDTVGQYFEYNISIFEESNVRIEVEFVGPNYAVYDFSIEELPIENRYPDTIEWRFQLHPDSPAEFDFFQIVSNFEILSGKMVRNPDNSNEYKIEFHSSIAGLRHTTSYLPFKNNEFWTIRLYKSHDNRRVWLFDIACSSDALYGKVNFHISGEFTTNIYLTSDVPDPIFIIIAGDDHILETGFHGWVQGLKTYYGNYTFDTFSEHVLNPASYSHDTFNGAYYRLASYFPLGLDLQRYTFNTLLDTVNSSQPNRNFPVTTLELVGFDDEDQSLNYHNDSETYYVAIPKIGGRTPQSAKIRIDDSELTGVLSPTKRSLNKEHDYDSPDSNRLAIVFSLSDQINRDIFNHMGISNLDQYIANPLDEYEEYHPDLLIAKNEYFRKYTQKNDINAFIRLLSAYDYSFFSQLKQLVPGRANLISGILIEPHILERNKIRIMKRPALEMNLWEPVIDGRLHRTNGEFIALESKIVNDEAVFIDSNRLYGDIDIVINSCASVDYIKYMIGIDTEVLAELIRTNHYSGGVRVTCFGTGDWQPVFEIPRPNCKYKIKNNVFTHTKRLTEYSLFKWLFTVPPGYPAFPSVLVDNTDTDLAFILNQDKRPFLKYIEIDDNDIPATLSTTTDLPIGDYVLKLFVEWNGSIANTSDLLLEVGINSIPESGTQTVIVPFGETSLYSSSRIVKEFSFNFTVSTAAEFDFELSFSAPSLTPTGSKIRYYGMSVYKRFSEYERELMTLDNKLNNRVEFSLLETTSYQNHEEYQRCKFRGAKLSSPAFNLPSDNTVDKGPVVEYRIVDSNILIVDSNNRSNTKIN